MMPLGHRTEEDEIIGMIEDESSLFVWFLEKASSAKACSHLKRAQTLSAMQQGEE